MLTQSLTRFSFVGAYLRSFSGHFCLCFLLQCNISTLNGGNDDKKSGEIFEEEKTDKRMEENDEIVVEPTSAMRFRSCEESGISKIFK